MPLVVVLVPQRNPNNMKSQLRWFMTATLSIAMLATAMAADQSSGSPAPATYLLTNDDGLLHSYVSFFSPGGTQSAPTLTFASSVGTVGQGIAGGYFGLPRLAILPTSSPQCVFASDAGTTDIAGINIQTQTLAGNFTGSDSDLGDGNGIGLVQNATYLY